MPNIIVTLETDNISGLQDKLADFNRDFLPGYKIIIEVTPPGRFNKSKASPWHHDEPVPFLNAYYQFEDEDEDEDSCEDKDRQITNLRALACRITSNIQAHLRQSDTLEENRALSQSLIQGSAQLQRDNQIREDSRSSSCTLFSPLRSTADSRIYLYSVPPMIVTGVALCVMSGLGAGPLALAVGVAVLTLAVLVMGYVLYDKLCNKKEAVAEISLSNVV